MMGSNYMPMTMMMKTMKRKELPRDVDVDEVSDDLHDFSLSSPTRKIRRLNVQLPPIMEEEREQEILGAESSSPVTVLSPVSDPAVNEEKAIVLYKPLLQSSSPCQSLSVSLDLISGFKNQFLEGSHAGHIKLAEENILRNKNDAAANNSLAVVPWGPCKFQLPVTSGMDVSHTEATMEADNMGEATMEIEDDNNLRMGQGNPYEFGGMGKCDGLNQWQQQHCMIPKLPQAHPLLSHGLVNEY